MSAWNSLARCRAAATFIVFAGVALFGACSQELPPRTTIDLMSDPAVRDAVLLRCNQLQGAALRDAECRNVREAVDRLAAEEQDSQSDEAQETQDSFEKAREARRAREERERRRREASEQAVDPYTMPLVPEQPTTSTPTVAVMSAASLPES